MAYDKKNILILIVDDSPLNLRTLGSLLTSEDYKISIAQNGTQALEVAANIMPDLILLDIMMPDIDGIEVCRQLKKKRTQKIYLLFLLLLYQKRKIK
ncbi:MAG: response regulator [Thiomargarita sp.]|nr:response regulator [Thiomargarita sp.]